MFKSIQNSEIALVCCWSGSDDDDDDGAGDNDAADNHFEITLEYLGVTLGSFWDNFGITLGSFWDHIGIFIYSRGNY